jgi:energy-coupling factor transporter ATP-binding protein EcfA2
MSRKQFSHRERRAYFEAYGEKCAYCPNAIEKQLYMEIDHVIYQALAERPSELKEVLKRHGLPDTFDLNGPLNLVCACKNCNSKKGATRPVATIDFGLKAAREKEPIVKRLLEKYRINKSVDNNLTSVGDDLEKGNTTREYVADFLGISKAASKPESVLQESELLRILGNASLGLAEWPQKTANQWMERPELDSILTRFDLPNSFTVLLGEPGSGKSALLAHIAGILTDRDVVHLALKADLLPPELATLGELNEYLGTPAPVVECLKELAESRPIVFLIDQLDAVCDLMVQKTARLTVLLGLINRLRGIENFHILLSCRSFEFRHDIRLNSLKPDAVILSDPPFAVVQQVLASSNIDSTMWPDEAKELLRRPQHLNFFLGHLTATESQRMLTYHSMMESVFQVRVLRPFGNETARTLEAIATTMSEEENLWLPLSRLEVNYGREVDRLLATGLLARSPDNLRVGFRHQTIFDFMRARAFASGVSNLAAYILERQDSLFVRPILWGTLHYLREADRKAYVREVQTLWVNLDLRQHIRFLLIDFVAQVQEPDSFEVAIIRPALSDRELRPHVVKCLKGNPAWFVCIKADMFSMMAGNDVEAYYASWLLRPALEFDAGNAISLIERFWIPMPSVTF